MCYPSEYVVQWHSINIDIQWLILRSLKSLKKCASGRGNDARVSSQITSRNAQLGAGLALISVYANHPWSVTEPEAAGVPGWQTGTKALWLYSLQSDIMSVKMPLLSIKDLAVAIICQRGAC